MQEFFVATEDEAEQGEYILDCDSNGMENEDYIPGGDEQISDSST